MKLVVCSVLAAISRAQAQPPLPQDTVEIDFEPLGPDDGPIGETVMLEGRGPTKKGKSPGGLSEKELDDVLADMLGPQNVPHKSEAQKHEPRNLPNDLSRIPDGAEVFKGDGKNGLPPGVELEIDGPPLQSEKDMDELLSAIEGRPPMATKPERGDPVNFPPGGDEVIMGNGKNGIPEGVVEIVGDEPPPEMMMMQEGPGPRGGPEDIPPEMLKQLFPPGVIIEEDDGPGPPRGGRPPPGADAVIQDLMNEMDEALVQQVNQQATENNLPSSCSKEVKAHCKDAKSKLHCLGKYNADISDGCRADVGKSVPFLCSEAIDNFCDVLMGGILSCLGNQMNNLQGPCKDAVLATKKIIQKVNSKKASQAAPKAKASLSVREANLDAKLIGLSAASPAKAKPPSVMPHLQEKLMDHDIRTAHGKNQESSQASPPFLAWFVPLCILLVGAFLAHRSSSLTANTMIFKNAANTMTFKNDPKTTFSHEAPETFRPSRTPSGMELLNPAHPGGRFDLGTGVTGI
jgi:hypothetical protein